MNRGEIFRCEERLPERGHKPGYYVVVSRGFIATAADVSTVVCAPIYSNVLGLVTEVPVGEAEGIPSPSAIQCDFLTLLFKSRLVKRVGALGSARRTKLDEALRIALELEG